MVLTINVTWPACLVLRVPIDYSDVEPITRKSYRSGDDLVIDGAFGKDNRVCDDDRYRLTYRIARQRDSLECCQRGASFERTLVVVLESPHMSEYQINCLDRPIGPAQGSTGHHIRDHLTSVLRSCRHVLACLDGRPTRVILANPIQFQTSLASVVSVPKRQGEHHEARKRRAKKIRDAVWGALWARKETQDEFKVRLRSYCPDFIINACTHDVGCDNDHCDTNRECKKHKIGDFLRADFPCAHIYTANHPYNWFNGNRRTLSLTRPSFRPLSP